MKKAAGFVVLAFLLWGFLSTVEAQVGTRDRSARPIGPQGYGSKGQPDQQSQQEERRSQRSAWLQGDERQQEQLAGCLRLATALTQHARDIRKMMGAGAVNWKEVAGQFEDLQRGVALLSEKHEQFALDLNNGQRTWWEQALRDIMSIQLQLSERMGAIERDVRGEKPEAAPVVKAMGDLEGRFRRWHEIYGRIIADMGLEVAEPRSASGTIRGLPGAQGPGR